MEFREVPSEANNPYQPPQVDPARAIIGVLDDALKTRDRVNFETVLSKRDQVDALRRTTMRPDLRRSRRIRWLLLIPSVLLLLVMLLRWIRSGQVLTVPAITLVVVIVLALYLAFLGYWTIRNQVKMNRDSRGPIKGWLDRESLWIENEHQTRYRPLSQLVGVAKNQRQLVLCFDTTHLLFETLPLRGFDDPDTIEILADNLARARPFSTAKRFDERRLQEPTDEPRFQPGEDALFYSGGLHRDDIHGTPLEDSQRRVRVVLAVQLAVFLGAILAFVFLISSSLEYRVMAVLVVGFVFVRALRRALRVPFAGQATDEMFWQSAGWIDQAGMFSMTATGQTKSMWAVFDRAVITDRVISVRTRSGLLWHLTGRGQFADDSDWEAACKRVREHVPTA